MSVVDFGYVRRPRGRHIPLPPQDDDDPHVAWRRDLATPEERAARVFERLQVAVNDAIDLHSDPRVVVVCGDPECAGDDGSGRWLEFRGRCPKCAGYVMTVGQIAKHRERVLAAAASGVSDGEKL